MSDNLFFAVRRLFDRRQRWSPTPSTTIGCLLITPFLLLVIVMVIYPFIRLAAVSLGPPDGPTNLHAYLNNAANVRVLISTFKWAGVVTILTMFVGSLFAWSLRTSQSQLWRVTLLAAVLVPSFMGVVIKNYAFTILLERFGIVNRLLTDMHVIHEPLSLLYTPGAVVIGMSYAMLPYAILPLYAGFSAINLDLLRAAEVLGASRGRGILSVILPLAAPAVFATATIVYVVSLGFFVTPVVLGGATSPFTATLISNDIFQFFDVSGADISAILLVAGAILVILIAYVVVGSRRLESVLE